MKSGRDTFNVIALLIALFLVTVGGAEAQDTPDFDPRGMEVITEIAEMYPNEVSICLYKNGYEIPETTYASRKAISRSRCRDDAVANAHTHPARLLNDTRFLFFFYNETGIMATDPYQLCYLSEADVKYQQSIDLEYAVVAVDTETWCWWTRDQIDAMEVDGIVQPPIGQIISRYTPAN